MNLMFSEYGVMIGTFFMIISMIRYVYGTFVLLNLTPLSVWVRLLVCNDGVRKCARQLFREFYELLFVNHCSDNDCCLIYSTSIFFCSAFICTHFKYLWRGIAMGLLRQGLHFFLDDLFDKI